MQQELLTADVARLAVVTPATVRNWANAGSLPARRTISGVRLFDRRDVERFIAAREKARLAARPSAATVSRNIASRGGAR